MYVQTRFERRNQRMVPVIEGLVVPTESVGMCQYRSAKYGVPMSISTILRAQVLSAVFKSCHGLILSHINPYYNGGLHSGHRTSTVGVDGVQVTVFPTSDRISVHSFQPPSGVRFLIPCLCVSYSPYVPCTELLLAAHHEVQQQKIESELRRRHRAMLQRWVVLVKGLRIKQQLDRAVSARQAIASRAHTAIQTVNSAANATYPTEEDREGPPLSHKAEDALDLDAMASVASRNSPAASHTDVVAPTAQPADCRVGGVHHFAVVSFDEETCEGMKECRVCGVQRQFEEL